jgi:putative Holliday junction resolvase
MSVREYLLGVDYGEKRVGIAIAHSVARLPRPLTSLPNTPQLLTEIRDLAEHEHVSLVVVGLPRGMDGGYTEQTRRAEAFQQRLATSLDVPVVLADETLTSVDAAAQQGGDLDAVAASLILERYFAEQRPEVRT